MEKQYYKSVRDEEAKNDDNKRSKVHENRKHMHKMTNAIWSCYFLKSWMCPFSPKDLFCLVLVRNVAVITADKCDCTQTNDRMIACKE